MPTLAVAHPMTVSARNLRVSAAPDGRAVAALPVFFPGTSISFEADILSLETGDERPGVDFVLGQVDTFRIEGQIVADGYRFPTPSHTSIGVRRMSDDVENPYVGADSSSTRDGTFTFDSVPAGHHIVAARWKEQGLWGVTDVVGAGGQTIRAQVQMARGRRVSGRFVLDTDGSSPAAPAFTA